MMYNVRGGRKKIFFFEKCYREEGNNILGRVERVDHSRQNLYRFSLVLLSSTNGALWFSGGFRWFTKR